MNIVTAAMRRPISVAVLIVALIGASIFALQRMSRDVFPPLGVPTIYVAQPFGGMDPAQMEGSLTYYYEYHFLYITGIEHVESKSIQGASLMKLQFHPGTDMVQAMSETIAYVNRARAFMPPGTVPPFVMRFDAGSVPVGDLVFSTENPARTVGEMQDAALNLVRPLFATLPGVSAPPPFGGSARTILVNAQPDRLRAYDLSPDDLVVAVAQANVVSPSGNITLGDSYPIVPVNAVVRNIKDLEALPLRTTAAGSVYLRDVATLQDGSDITTSFALVNGRRTVYIPVTKRAEASTVDVVGLVRANLARFQGVLPADVRVSFEFDQTPVVLHSIGNLVREGLLGALLTGLMVLLFLRDWRSALLVVINIPVALLAASLGLWLTGQNVNLMTLGGLALAVGILVDEATVAVENIHAHLAKGATLRRAALDATSETAGPRFLAMACILAVFTPALFMSGAARALFVPLALAVAFSMVASFLLSSTLVPILSVWLLGEDHRGMQEEGLFKRLRHRYEGTLRFAFGIRWILLAAYLGLTGISVSVAASHTGVEIFPASSAGQFALRLRGPSGTKVERTEALALKALEIVKREAGPENVALTLGLVGVHAPNYPINLVYLWNGGPEEGWLAVQLREATAVRIDDLQEKLRAAFARELPEVRFSFEPSDIVSRVMSFGSNTPIEIAVSGPDLEADRVHAESILTKLREIPFLRDLQIVQNLDYPAVNVDINRERAGTMGVKVSDVTRSLVPATTSSRFTVPNYWSDARTGVSYNVQIQFPQSPASSLEDLRNVPISTKTGPPVLLRNFANVSTGSVVGQYERYNMARVVSMTANIHGADLGTAAARIRSAIEEVGPAPAKVSVSLRGQIVPLEELLAGFRSGLVVAIVVIFLMLTANFESLRLSLVVLSTVPAVLAGVMLMLWSTGTTLNIQSAIGAIMAVGVAVANAILLVTFAERARRTGLDSQAAAVEGASGRLRPILMTSFAMLAGMTPLALGLGEGGEQGAALGRSVAGGLLLATVATLVVLPAIFAMVQADASRHSSSMDPDDPSSQAPSGQATEAR